MRIAYGIMGYGRGHAMRSSVILRHLCQRHEVRVYAGPDAHAVLKDDFESTPIPCIHYRYGAHGRIDPWMTVRRNVRPSLDLLFGGQGTRAIARDWDAFRPEVVISDSEAWSHQLARARRIPRISLDHVGIMAYCKPEFPGEDLLLGQRDRLGYLAMMGVPEFAIVSSFYPAPARYPNVRVVGPILRDLVYAATPHQGEHLLAYFNKGEYQFSPGLEQALRACGRPVIVYGAGRQGQDENLLFKAPSQKGFVADMASATGVITTAGHQTASECLWLGKPMLLLPEDAVEQRLNAHMVKKMGIGDRASLTDLTGYDIERFLQRLPEFAAAMQPHRRDGRRDALIALEHALERSRELNRMRPRPLSIRAALGRPA